MSGHKSFITRRAIKRAISQRPPVPWDGTGCDTETFEGWARLICTPDDWVEVRRGAWRKAFRFLIDHPKAIFYNLRFDAEAILKHLPRDVLRYLLVAESVTYRGWRIDLVPWKMVRLTEIETDAVTELYDISPFYSGGLDHVSRRILKEGKIHTELGIDRQAINTDPKVWDDHLGDLIRYCQDDAYKTHRLADVMSTTMNRIGASFDRPYSVAFCAADVLTRDIDPPRLAENMKPMGEQAMYGARFECIMRGRFPVAHAYDIKSAYPAAMMMIEDSVKGRWVHRRGPPDQDALQAIVKGTARVDPEVYPILGPLGLKTGKNRPIVYPTGTFPVTVPMRTYERFQDVIEPSESWSWIPSGDIYHPYQRTLRKLLRFREDADPVVNATAKTAACSIYGKTMNRNEIKRLYEVDESGIDFTVDEILETREGMYRVERQTFDGSLYHPFHASLITEDCRLRIWDAVEGLHQNVIMIQADGVLMDRQHPRIRRRTARKVGDLGWVGGGDTLSLGSGQYDIRNEATKTRGVVFGTGGGPRRMSGPKSWFGALRGVREPYVRFSMIRPAHLSECLSGVVKVTGDDGEQRRLTLKDVNVFVRFDRNVNVTEDQKRVWAVAPEARLLLKQQFTSDPLHVESGEETVI